MEKISSRVKKRMKAFLNETIEHYNSNNRSFIGERCTYVPEDLSKSEGCAIGRKLPKKHKEKLLKDKLNIGYGVLNLFGKLGTPKIFKGMPDGFLSDVQYLHDLDFNWDENGITSHGENEVNKIIEKFDLY